MQGKETELLGVPGDEIRVLVVGNNPIELGRVFDCLNGLSGKRVISVMAFDLKTIILRLGKFVPHFILIDDNLGRAELASTVQALRKHRKTRRVPITLLKNSNYDEALITGVTNYILKPSLSGESLYQSLKNSTRLLETHRYLHLAYRKRKGQLARLLR